MITRRDLVADMLRLRSYQPLHCKQLFRSNHFVGAPRRTPNTGIDLLDTDPFDIGIPCPYRKSNPGVLVVQSAQDRAAYDVAG